MKYMNKLTLGIVLAAGLFTACSDKDDVDIPGGLALDKKLIAVDPQGGTEQIAIAASQDWVANTSEPWLMLSPANGVGSVEGTIKVDSTLSNTLRSTEISFQGANGQSRTLTITQFGYGKQIFLKDPVVEIENSDTYDNRAFESLISANVECKIGKIEYSFEGDMTDAEKTENESEREGWLLNSKDEDKLKGTNLGIVLDRKYRPRTVNFKFRWAMNVVPAVRVAKVHLVPVKAEDKLVDADGNPTADVILTVRQKAAPKIEDNRAGDSLSVIMINQKLGSSLETLNLVSNNFNKLSDITNIVNEKNFPKLRNLILYAQRRTDVVTNIASLGEKNASGVYVYNNYPIGLYGKVNAGSADRQALLKLLTWDKLNTLELSYCFLEGELPTDEEMTEALEAAGKATRYSESDFSTNKKDYLDKLVGDTCKWLLSRWDNPVTCKHKDGSVVSEEVCPNQVPRVLPNCRQLSLNLNFFTGKVPNWILFHPHLVEWNAPTMIFNQQPKGKNSDGAAVGFSNMTEDSYSYDYYYGTSDPGSQWEVRGVAYPLYYRKYVAAGDINEAALMAKYRRTKKK